MLASSLTTGWSSGNTNWGCRGLHQGCRGLHNTAGDQGVGADLGHVDSGHGPPGKEARWDGRCFEGEVAQREVEGGTSEGRTAKEQAT